MTDAPAERRPRRTRILWPAAGVVAVVVVGLTAVWTLSDDGEQDRCAVPSALELVELAQRSEAVVRGTVQSLPDLSDGTTRSSGWVVRVDEPLTVAAGSAVEAGGSVAVWPAIGDGPLTARQQVVLYLVAHSGATSAKGTVTPGFDSLTVLVDNGDDTVSRLCKDSRSDPVDRSIVG